MGLMTRLLDRKLAAVTLTVAALAWTEAAEGQTNCQWNSPGSATGVALNLASCNVGIGMTSPPTAYRLEVDGGAMALRDTGTGGHTFVFNPNAGLAAGVLGIGDASTGTLLYVDGSSGNLGIGTPSPHFPLHLTSSTNTPPGAVIALRATSTWPTVGAGMLMGDTTADNLAAIVLYGAGFTVPHQLWIAQGQNAPMSFATNGFERLRIDGSGSVGIGTINPVNGGPALEVANSVAGTLSELWISNLNTATNAGAALLFRADASPKLLGQIWALRTNLGVAVSSSDLLFRVNDGSNATTGLQERMRLTSTGRVGIGTPTPQYALDVVGSINASQNITAAGNIAAKYQDVAEWVPGIGSLAPGTVVTLAKGASNRVVAARSAYDTAVAGVVSARPGLILGEGGEGKAMIATTGRVKVKADARGNAIEIGDLLVTSDLEGYAMKSEPLEVAGVKIHRPGTLIGKALEALPRGEEGEILVLLSLQ